MFQALLNRTARSLVVEQAPASFSVKSPHRKPASPLGKPNGLLGARVELVSDECEFVFEKVKNDVRSTAGHQNDRVLAIAVIPTVATIAMTEQTAHRIPQTGSSVLKLFDLSLVDAGKLKGRLVDFLLIF